MRYKHGTGLLLNYVSRVFPEVNRQLAHWTRQCEKANDKMLYSQALSSISLKRFHALGGGVYSLYPDVDMLRAIRFIVSFQTISDYLDNLCDRAGVCDERSFRQLHLSMLDAVDPERDINDYYLFYPYQNDNNYLKSLVKECRHSIRSLPSYELVLGYIKKYVQLYSDLQTYKHLENSIRESRLSAWADIYLKQYPEISCWEFSAATGSTLGIFVLFAAASNPLLTGGEAALLDCVYFPWICGLHILLDYYIDSQEDMQAGDFNFTYYYDNLKHCEDRLAFFVKRSMECCRNLPYPEFHTTIIRGLLAMYLSDQKASLGLNKLISRSLIEKGGPGTIFYYNMCKLLRFMGRM